MWGEVLTCVTSFARVCHQGVLVQLPRLVIRGFKDRGAAHRRLGSCDNGEVLAGDT